MAWQGKLPFHHQLETRYTPQPNYHTDSVCGSSFHGLAYSVENQIQKGYVNDAMTQVKTCIEARQAEMQKRSYPDPAHNAAIEILINFYHKLQIIRDNYGYFAGLLHTTLVRYNDNNRVFMITISNMTIGGKNKIKRKQTKKTKQTKKNKQTKKTKLRFRYKKNKTLKKNKLTSK